MDCSLCGIFCLGMANLPAKARPHTSVIGDTTATRFVRQLLWRSRFICKYSSYIHHLRVAAYDILRLDISVVYRNRLGFPALSQTLDLSGMDGSISLSRTHLWYRHGSNHVVCSASMCSDIHTLQPPVQTTITTSERAGLPDKNPAPP